MAVSSFVCFSFFYRLFLYTESVCLISIKFLNSMTQSSHAYRSLLGHLSELCVGEFAGSI